MKAYSLGLRQKILRAYDQRLGLQRAIAQALATMTASDARSWFHCCGYAVQ